LKNSFIFLFFSLFSCYTFAIEVTNLYEFKVLVEDKSRLEQNRASRVGFIGVLKKVSGESINPSHASIQQAYKKLSNFVLKYEYQESLHQTSLTIRFQPKMVDNVLTAMNKPIWGNRRPLTLIWLAIEEDKQRSLMTQEDYPQIFQTLIDKSENAGLPLVLPLLDLTDRMNLSVTDVWANFPDQIFSASERYEPEIIVSGRLYRDKNVWQLDWQFSNYGSFKSNNLNGDKLSIMGEFVDSITQEITQQYVSNDRDNNNTTAIIRFTGLNSLFSIEALKSRLSSLTQVNEIDIKYKRSDQVDLVFYLNTNQDSLQKALQLDPLFEQKVDPFNYQKSDLLEYHWLGK
jgi:hypothetical protein